jgi:hypothetical protein
MSQADVTIRVSKQTLLELQRLGGLFATQSVDATIRRLIKERRSAALSRIMGSGKGIVSRFTEADRVDSHN